jgi:hypothetical protein
VEEISWQGASGVDPPAHVGVVIVVGYGEEDEELRRLP